MKMNADVRNAVQELQSADRNVMSAAFLRLQEATNQKVDWAYEVWESFRADLTHQDNHRRAIAAQLLCNLAKSDPERRILDALPALMEVTRDKRFVTARHALLSLWKIGLAGNEQKETLLRCLESRFRDSAEEKNGTLIRFDIVQSLRKLYDREPDERVKRLALALINTETDEKYRKKYAKEWKDVAGA
jgi:hypothetical protein